jgi:hypothetical protein
MLQDFLWSTRFFGGIHYPQPLKNARTTNTVMITMQMSETLT